MLQLTLSLDRLQQLDDLALSRLVSAATLTDLMQFWAPSLPHLMHAGERFVRAFSHRSEQLSAGVHLQSSGWLAAESSWMTCHCGRWLRAQCLCKMREAEAALAAYRLALRQHSDAGEMAYEAAKLACQLQQPNILRELLHALVPEQMDYTVLNRWATLYRRCSQQHAEWFAGPVLRVAVLLGSSTQFLAPLLPLVAIVYGLRVELFTASGPAVASEIFEPSSKLYAFKPDIVFLGDSSRNLDLHTAETDQLWVDKHVHSIQASWAALLQNGIHSIVQQNYLAASQADYDQWDSFAAQLPGGRVVALNQAINEQAIPAGIQVLDLEQVRRRLCSSQAWEDARLWYSLKQCPSLEALPELAAAYVARLRAMAGLSKKVLVLDLDNTLWGGVVSELGSAGIDVGGHSPQGEAYADFQRYLRKLKQRGVLLAVCSKNEEQQAKAPFRRADAGLLNLDDFVAFTANWEPKWSNLQAMARNLNLSLDSFVFVDDSPVECLEMRAHLPQVTVIQLPNRVENYIACLERGRWFEFAAMSADDGLRTERYRANQQRNSVLCQAPSFEDFLADLGMQVKSAPVDQASLRRVEQLLQRCNQFNLNGRKWSHASLQAMLENADYWMRWFQLSDRFGDYGLCACVVVKQTACCWELEALVMSCRAMGRSLELHMMNTVVRAAHLAGAQHLRIAYEATTKNEPLRVFLQQYVGEAAQAWCENESPLIRTDMDSYPKTAISEVSAS